MKKSLIVLVAILFAACSEDVEVASATSTPDDVQVEVTSVTITAHIVNVEKISATTPLLVRVSFAEKVSTMVVDATDPTIRVSTFQVPVDLTGPVTASFEIAGELVNQDVELFVNGLRVCNRDEIAYNFSLPFTVAQSCDEVDEAHVTKQVVLLEKWKISCDESQVQILENNAELFSFATVDLEHLTDTSCREKILEWKRNTGMKVHCYVNPTQFFTNIPEREWQTEMETSMPEIFKLNKVDGTPASTWCSGTACMEDNDLLFSAPTADGLSYQEWYADSLSTKLAQAGHSEICDGIHLDNMNAIESWIIDFLGPLDAIYNDVWDFDYQWRQGLRYLVEKIHERLPEMEISCRAKSHVFGDICQQTVFEQGVGGHTDIPGGWFAKIYQAYLMVISGTQLIFHHDATEVDFTKNYNSEVAKAAESGFAISLILGADNAFDLSGDAAHGEWPELPVLQVTLGQSTTDIEWPYEMIYESQDFVISDRQTHEVGKVGQGDVAVFWRDLSGTFGSTEMTGLENTPRWNSGLFYHAFTQDTDFTFGIKNDGVLSVEGLKVFSPSSALSTGYFYRRFEKGEAYVNPSANETITVTLIGDVKLIIPPQTGCIILFNAEQVTSCQVR